MPKKLFNRIKVVLAEKDRSNNWLAEKMNRNPNTVSHWVTNKAQPPIETLFEIAKVLDVDVRQLLVSTKP